MKREELVDKLLGGQKTDYAIKKIAEHDWEDPQQLLEEIAEGLEVELPKKSPADFVKELDDSEDKVYVWNMHMDDPTVKKFCKKFENEFVQKYNRNPESLHFIRNDVEKVEDLDPVDLRKALNQIENEGEE